MRFRLGIERESDGREGDGREGDGKDTRLSLTFRTCWRTVTRATNRRL